jgi:hypothetical protein
MSLFDIDYSTNLSVRIYDFTVNWVNKIIILDNSLTSTHGLRIDLYEVGNGDQLVKSNSQAIPFIDNIVTGFVEMPLNCNYSASRFNGSGAIRPTTDPKQVIAIETDALDNSIVCETVEYFVVNSSIIFQGDVFGGITTDTIYYVKTISYITNKITVSTSDPGGIAGPTFDVTSDTGSMLVNIQSTNGLVWTDPILIHNGTNLVLGEQGIVSETNSGTNTIIVNSTDNYAVNDRITFSNAMSFNNFILTAGSFVLGQLYKIATVGTTNFTAIGALSNTVGVIFTATGTGTGTGTVLAGIIPLQSYYITSIDSDPARVTDKITVSAIAAGADVILSDTAGIALCVTNDYAITIADQGITAKLVFSSQYNQNDDFVVLSIFGETAPIQYGYTVPEVQIFTLTSASTEFALTNFVGQDNADNAIVEYNGLRLTNNADYTINSSTNTLSLTIITTAESILSVTTYNLTDRQYLNTIYAGSFTGSVTTVLTISDAIHEPGFDDLNYDIGYYSPGPDYLTLGLGTTETINVNDAIKFNDPTIGGIVSNQIYYIVNILSSTTFAVSENLGGTPVTLITESGSMTGITNPPTVANITAINNSINQPLAVTTVTNTTVTTNLITCGSTVGFILNQPVMFKNNTEIGFGNINADGTVYYVKSIVGLTSFTISETLVAGVAGPTLELTTATGLELFPITFSPHGNWPLDA